MRGFYDIIPVIMNHRTTAIRAFLVVLLVAPLAGQPARLGYYRFPAVWRDTLVFTAEGDLWRVPLAGGVAQRLTTHTASETRPAISPDGRTVAYSASYEGPTEVYTLPLEGGVPVRQTYDGGNAQVVGWTPSGEILYATSRFSGLPNTQLVKIGPATRTRALVPLAQASDGAYDAKGATLYFTRQAFQGSHTRRYKGGTAQNLWTFTEGAESVPLTADYDGTSKTPMPWQGRVYFASDRDGAMNIWSMAEEGGDLRQHTRHRDFEVRSPSLSEGRIAYQLGADIHVLDLASGADRIVPITLVVRLRPGAREMGGQPDRLGHRRPPLPGRRPRRAHRARPGVRRAGRAGPPRRGHPQPARALPQRALLPGRQERAGRSPTRAARWSSGACRPTASARPRSSRPTRRCCAGTASRRPTAA